MLSDLDALPVFMTPQEVADLLRVTRRTIENMMADGRLARVSNGTDRVLIPRQAVIDILNIVPPTKATPSRNEEGLPDAE